LAPGSVDEPGLPAGTAIGRYRLVEAGPGPTGHTYRATSTETGRPVVLIFLARMLAYGVESGSPYVVHEQVAGQRLGALLDRSEPLWPGPMSLLRQVAAALDFAHTAGVINGGPHARGVLEQGLPPQAGADGCPAFDESKPKPRLESEPEPITDAIVLAFGRRRRRQPDGISLTRR